MLRVKGEPAGRPEFGREALLWLDDVFRFAQSLTRDVSDAEDLVQETYLRAFRSWHTYRPDRLDGDARRWLFTICRNAFLRSRERLARETTLAEGDLASWVPGLSGGGGGAPSQTHEGPLASAETEAMLSRLDLAPALARAVGELPEPYRAAVVLVDVEDQSYDAAAEALGIPLGTVRSRLFRGRRLLQERLIEFARDAGLAGPPRDDRER